MNKERRKDLNEIAEAINDLRERLECLKDDEQEYFDNMPENFQYGERGEAAEEAIDNIDSAIDSIGEACGYIEAASE